MPKAFGTPCIFDLGKLLMHFCVFRHKLRFLDGAHTLVDSICNIVVFFIINIHFLGGGVYFYRACMR